MIRRRFLSLITLTSASTLAALSAKPAAKTQTLTYKIQGFTCPTCATGLETLLERQKGILTVKASYPTGQTTITYNPDTISPKEITQQIESLGFKPQLQTPQGEEL